MVCKGNGVVSWMWGVYGDTYSVVVLYEVLRKVNASGLIAQLVRAYG